MNIKKLKKTVFPSLCMRLLSLKYPVQLTLVVECTEKEANNIINDLSSEVKV
jgi:hypothetical protein